MPGNLVVINRSERLTWYVGDSRMDELIEFLHKVGFQEHSKEPTNQPFNAKNSADKIISKGAILCGRIT